MKIGGARHVITHLTETHIHKLFEAHTHTIDRTPVEVVEGASMGSCMSLAIV